MPISSLWPYDISAFGTHNIYVLHSPYSCMICILLVSWIIKHTHTHTQFQFLKISFFVGTRNKRGRVFRPCGHVRVFSHSFRLLRTSFMLITSLVAQTNTPTFWKEYLLNTWSLFHFTESQASELINFMTILENLDQKNLKKIHWSWRS